MRWQECSSPWGAAGWFFVLFFPNPLLLLHLCFIFAPCYTFFCLHGGGRRWLSDFWSLSVLSREAFLRYVVVTPSVTTYHLLSEVVQLKCPPLLTSSFHASLTASYNVSLRIYKCACLFISVVQLFTYLLPVTDDYKLKKREVRVAQRSPLACQEIFMIWREQSRKRGLISPPRPRAWTSCGCRDNLSQMHWLEPDSSSWILSPRTLQPHGISKPKPSVSGVSPTLNKSNSNTVLWNVRRVDSGGGGGWGAGVCV